MPALRPAIVGTVVAALLGAQTGAAPASPAGPPPADLATLPASSPELKSAIDLGYSRTIERNSPSERRLTPASHPPTLLESDGPSRASPLPGAAVPETSGAAAQGPTCGTPLPPVEQCDQTRQTAWTVRYDGRGDSEDVATHVGVDTAGTRAFVTGYSWGANGTLDIATIAYDATSGAQRWLARFDAGDRDVPWGLAVSPDGAMVYVTAESWLGDAPDFTTIAYDGATGVQRWLARYNGGAWDLVQGVTAGADGERVFVTGMVDAGGFDLDYATVAYDSTTGAQLWATRYAGPGRTDEPFSVAASPDGSRVFVTGTSQAGPTAPFDFATAAYDAASGAELWIQRYDRPGSGQDIARALAVSPNGTQVYVAGDVYIDRTFYLTTLAYDAATGARIWERGFDDGAGAAAAAAGGIAIAPDGSRAYVVGLARAATGTQNDIVAVALDAATGARVWTSRYDGPFHGDEHANRVAVSPDGSRAYVAGSSADAAERTASLLVAFDTSSGGEAWVSRAFGPGDGWDTAASVAIAPDGGRILATGPSTGDGTGPDYRTVALDPATGTALWTSRYTGAVVDQDTAAAAVLSPDGTRIFTAGSTKGSGGWNTLTTAADAATGSLLWSATFDGTGHFSDGATGIAVDPFGRRIYIAGYSQSTDADYVTIAYDATTGGKLWVARYEGPGLYSDVAYSVAASPDGSRVFVTGTSYGTGGEEGGGTGWDATTIAYDSATGAPIWNARYDNGVEGTDAAYAVAVSRDGGRVVVAGETWNGSNFDYLTVTYDATSGAPLWNAKYNGPGNKRDSGYSLALSPDGARAFVTGYSTGSANLDYGTVSYDAATGTQLWAGRYNGPDNGNDGARAVAVAPDGQRVFVTGESVGSTTPGGLGTLVDYATVAFDATDGALRWSARYNGPGNNRDGAYAIGVSPTGARVYVTGESWNGTNYDATTVAYDALAGSRSWVTRYDAAGAYDGALSLAVRRDGARAYVAGSSFAQDTLSDATTQAYDITRPPTVRITAEPAVGKAPLAVRFGVEAGDPDGAIASWAFDFDGDGAPESNGTGTPPSALTHTYPAGSFTARITVVDGDGATGTAVAAITSKGNSAPVLDPLVDQTVREGELLEFAVRAHDPDDDRLTYRAAGVPPGATFDGQTFSWRTTFDQAGTYTGIRFEASDGETVDEQEISITVVNVPRAPVISDPLDGATVTSPVAVDGRAEPHSTVIVREGSSDLASTTADASGSWAIPVGLPDGEHELRATATDPEGNAGPPSDPRTLFVRTDPPVIIAPADGALLRSSSVGVSGTAIPGAALTVTENGAAIGSGMADPTGTWSVSIRLSDGTHEIRAIATTTSGVVRGPSERRRFTVDTVAPAPPSVDSPTPDATIRAHEALIAGSAEPGSLVTVSEGGVLVGMTQADAGGRWSLARSFADGPHTIAVTATDRAGNVGPSVLRRFRVETAPAVESPAEGSIQPAAVTFAGTAAPLSNVRVDEGATVIGTARADVTGSWSFNVNLDDGAHRITATATDSSGRTSPPSPARAFEVDVSPPGVTITTPDRSVFTPTEPATIRGTATDNRGVARVELRFYDATGARKATVIATCTGCGAGGTDVGWSATPDLPSGIYSVQANAIDRAGNRSAVRSIVFLRV